MTNKKLTDSEIVKALGSYKADIGCAKCGFKDKYLLTVIDNAFDLNNRLQAENERLKRLLDEEEKKYTLCAKRFFTEGVKEFAEEYKDQIKNYTGIFTDDGFMVNLEAVLSAVDFIKNKLVGEDNES